MLAAVVEAQKRLDMQPDWQKHARKVAQEYQEENKRRIRQQLGLMCGADGTITP